MHHQDTSENFNKASSLVQPCNAGRGQVLMDITNWQLIPNAYGNILQSPEGISILPPGMAEMLIREAEEAARRMYDIPSY